MIVTLERLVLCRVTCCMEYIRGLEDMPRACVLDHKGRGLIALSGIRLQQ